MTGTLTVTGPVPSLSGAVFDDIRDQGASPDCFMGYMIRVRYGGVGSKGNRFGLYSYFTMDAPPDASDTSPRNYTSATFQSAISVPAKAGLTGGATYSGYAGALWAADMVTNINGGAKNWDYLVGGECGVSIYSPASSADRFGLPIYSGGDEQGILDDAAVMIAQNASLTPWRTGIQFGGTRKNSGIDANGTYMGAKKRTQGGTFIPVGLYGIDFRDVQWTAGGAPFISTGFSVDPAGKVTASKIKASALPTSAAGLSSGDIWRDAAAGNVLKVVP